MMIACISPDTTNYFNHTYNQLVSYIVTYFKAKYEITSDGRIVDNSMKGKLKEFKAYLPLWYLYDNIRGFWLGSGDTKLDKLVLTDDIFSSPYFSKVSEDSFRIALQDWLTNENTERNPSVKPESKLFINYIIKKRCSEPHNGMEIEHIIPQIRLELLSSREKGVTGISSPSNLTLIPKFDNRSKREKTYYELVDLRDNSAMTYDTAQLDKYLYPEHSEIKFIEAQSEFTVAKFNQFKKDRTNTLINTFIDEYY